MITKLQSIYPERLKEGFRGHVWISLGWENRIDFYGWTGVGDIKNKGTRWEGEVRWNNGEAAIIESH